MYKVGSFVGTVLLYSAFATYSTAYCSVWDMRCNRAMGRAGQASIFLTSQQRDITTRYNAKTLVGKALVPDAKDS